MQDTSEDFEDGKFDSSVQNPCMTRFIAREWLCWCAHPVHFDFAQQRIGQHPAIKAEDEAVKLRGIHNPNPQQHFVHATHLVPTLQIVADGKLQLQRRRLPCVVM